MKLPEVVKSNELIQASYTLSLVEQRLILLAIVEARETGQGIDATAHLSVSAAAYAHQFGLSPDAAYKALFDASKGLFERQVTFSDTDPSTNKPRKRITRWVSEIAYIEGSGQVQLIFAPAIVPEITRLESNFTSYDLEQVASLQSAYAVRLYELLIKWRSVGKTPLIKLDDFRGQLGVNPDDYARIELLKRRVLEPSITQISKHTDLIVAYEQVKSGRNIIGFHFKFKIKKAAIEADTPKTSKSGKAAIKGISPKDMPAFIAKHRHPHESSEEAYTRLMSESKNGAVFTMSYTD
jgi:plasmid replication initiation protein